MVQITPSISIDDSELHFDFVRASGPGGQNVNKVATAVQLRFDVLHSPSLPEDVRWRLMTQAGSRVSGEGVLIIDARQHRTQEQNRKEALDRLVTMVRKAAHKPKARKPTRPSAASKRKRLEAKRQRGEVKALRRKPAGPEE